MKERLAANLAMTRGVSIVIPTWNGVALLKQFLPSVIEAATCYSNQSKAPIEIIIVDDASSDETIEWLAGEGFSGQGSGVGGRGSGNELKKPLSLRQSELSVSDLKSGIAENISNLEPEISENQPLTPARRFIRNETNRGFGETCNRGVEAASHGLVFLLNNDVEVERGAIKPLAENFADEKVFAVHCRVFELEDGRECGTGKLGGFARGFIRVHKSYAALDSDEETSGDEKQKKSERRDSRSGPLYSVFAGGGSAMFDREKFIALGGFEPLLSPFYWEDVELSYRAWKRGLVVLYEPRSVARHRVSSTIGKLKRSKVKKIEQRNRLLLHWINLHDKRLLASHMAWIALLAVTAPLRLRFDFLSSLAMAIKQLPQISRRRMEEKRAAKRSDRDVLEIFASLEKREDVFAYDDYEELRRLNEKRGARK